MARREVNETPAPEPRPDPTAFPRAAAGYPKSVKHRTCAGLPRQVLVYPEGDIEPMTDLKLKT